MVRQCPILSESDMSKKYIKGLCKGSYWKSLTPNHMSVYDPLVTYHLSATTTKQYQF